MQTFPLSSSPLLLLSLLLLSSFHGRLYVANAQSFDFPTGKITKNSLTSLQHGTLDSSGTLTLDSSTGDAQAFYSNPITLSDTISQSVLSFASFFTFASSAASGNGTIAFAIIPDVTETGGLTEARKTFTIEFNASCATGVYNGSEFNGGPGFYGMGDGYRGGGRGGGFFGGLGGFQVFEYANNTSIAAPFVGGYGPDWNDQPPQGPYFCSQQPPVDLTNPTFQYQVALEYNATTDSVSVGSPSCGAAIARTTEFAALNLSGVITKPVYVGFIVSGGGIFNITQWNFTSNTNTSYVSSLALSSSVSPATDSGSPSIGDGRDGRGHSGLKKGYVVAFSILGAAIGVAAVLLVCCLCARRRRVTSARFVAKSVNTGVIPESAVVFDAKKPQALPAKVVLVDRDTAPLNTHPNSVFHGSTGAASWLQPVAPR